MHVCSWTLSALNIQRTGRRNGTRWPSVRGARQDCFLLTHRQRFLCKWGGQFPRGVLVLLLALLLPVALPWGFRRLVLHLPSALKQEDPCLGGTGYLAGPVVCPCPLRRTHALRCTLGLWVPFGLMVSMPLGPASLCFSAWSSWVAVRTSIRETV